MTEDDRLIIKFMGLKPIEKEDITEHTNVNEYVYLPRYRSEWNWLMPVVEKIESLPGWNFSLSQQTEAVIYDDDYKWMAQGRTFRATEPTKIGSVVKVVIDFIKWYNDRA